MEGGEGGMRFGPGRLRAGLRSWPARALSQGRAFLQAPRGRLPAAPRTEGAWGLLVAGLGGRGTRCRGGGGGAP